MCCSVESQEESVVWLVVSEVSQHAQLVRNATTASHTLEKFGQFLYDENRLNQREIFYEFFI
jgi:hypothetical protein